VEGSVLVIVSAWSESIGFADRLGIDGAVSWDFTTTFCEADDVAISGVVAPSLT
jgi:hypothetical protein